MLSRRVVALSGWKHLGWLGLRSSFRSVSSFGPVKGVPSAVKAPTYQPLKPIAEVLEECRPGPEWDEKRVVWSKLIFDAGISTAKNWHDLSDATKKELQENGLPEAVINALNNYVPPFLLKAPTYQPLKPIAEVLEECRPGMKSALFGPS